MPRHRPGRLWAAQSDATDHGTRRRGIDDQQEQSEQSGKPYPLTACDVRGGSRAHRRRRGNPKRFGAGAAQENTAGKPKLKLIAASNSVTLDRYEWDGASGVFLDLGTYLSVDDAPLEFKVTRKSYKDPVVAQQILRDGTSTKPKTKTLPAGLVKDFTGLAGFIDVSIKNAAGEEVSATKGTFCPNNASGRIRPDAPATSKYPQSCPTNPFTLGSVWGVEKGWASNTSSIDYDKPVDLPVGEYTAKVGVAKEYRDLFGIPDDQHTIKVTVRSDGEGREGAGAAASRSSASSAHHGGGNGAGHGAGHDTQTANDPAAAAAAAAHHYGPRGADAPTPPALSHALEDRGLAHHLGDGPGHTDGSRIAPALKPAAKRPSGRAGVPADVPKPDLRSLPGLGHRHHRRRGRRRTGQRVPGLLGHGLERRALADGRRRLSPGARART